MSVGPSPDVSGNVTAGAICVSCPDHKSQHDPRRRSDYPERLRLTGAPIDECGAGGVAECIECDEDECKEMA